MSELGGIGAEMLELVLHARDQMRVHHTSVSIARNWAATQGEWLAEKGIGGLEGIMYLAMLDAASKGDQAVAAIEQAETALDDLGRALHSAGR